RNIAGAYYQTGQYTKALKLYQPLASAGDRQAKLKLAEIQFKIGDRQAADRLFSELIAENPRDFEVLVARGALYAGLGNHRLALQDYEKALRLVSVASISENAVRDLHDRLAAAYINLGHNEQAISLLQSYINTNTASLSMQGNYILALRGSGQYRLAIAEGNRLWPGFASGPLFGLRAIAESYVQLNNNTKAVEVYNHILSRSPEDVDARFGLAFSQMLEGRIIEGLGVYEKLIAENPQRKSIALHDADMMLATNRFLAGKALYDHLLRRFPDNSMRQRYAEALARHRHNRAAFKQYTILAQSPESEYVGLAGQVKTSLALQDYRQARIAYEALSAKYGRSSAVAVLSEIYLNRPQGDLYNSFVYNTSHKNLRTQAWQSSAEQNIADNYWLSVVKGRTRLDDFSTPQEYRILNSTGVGLSYQDINGSISLRTAHIAGGNSLATYALTTERRLTDQTTLSLAYGKDVLLDVQALNSADGSIMTRTFGLRLARELSPKESFNLSLNRTVYSDENRSTAFSLEHNYLLYDRNNRALSRSLYWNRSYFHRESPLYESPSLRESLGASWLLRRSFANSYWQTRLTANWAHDLPDSLTFEPYLRCEWGRDFSASHALAIGAEYGLRSQSIFGSGLKYGYHQLDFVYRIRW
ncbi:MAG: tetratricopeptide repeat protein, partial [Negativicutes bacterium]|nr:tetratricopeptide repeat protein [Negativicutes bacterium]